MPIKSTFIFIISLCSCTLVYTQIPPTVEWENSYGGEGDDQSYVVEPTSDGGYISAGWTESTGGDASQNPGYNSLFVVKTDGSGDLEWSNVYGGSNTEVAQDVIETSDGGYLVVGLTSSNDGDVSELVGGAWVIKLDTNGNIVWEKTYSGDEAIAVLETATGYVVSINRYSVNLTQNKFRLIKIDFTGNIIWEYTHEESSISKGIMRNSDGDYIVAGYTYSVDAYYNLLLVKVDATGNLIWEQSYGGSYTDVAGSVSMMIYSVSTSDIITETADGGYMVVGTTNSEDGDVSQHIGMYDVWLIKTDDEGNLEWEKSYGGTLPDHGVTIKKTLDEKYMITSTTYSGNGDISQNYNGWDFWIFKIDLNGNIEWENIYGSDHNDHATSFHQINECEFIASGYSWGSDFDISQNHGDADFWIVKLIIDLNPPIAENPQTFCELDEPTINDIEIDTDVSEGIPFTFNWYFDESGTEEIPATDIPIEDGETYYVSQTVSGCESAIQAIETFIIDDELPVANSPQEFCEDDSPTIENININGENLTWYADEAGNDPLPENTSLENNQTYYVSQTIGNCESSLLPIEILLYPSPDIVTFEPLPLSACDNDNDTLADTPFDLTIPGSEITQENDIVITYFKTESSAQQGNTGTDEFIQNPAEYTNEPLYHEENGAYGISQTIYARVKSTDTENFCALVVPIQLMIIPPPILNVKVDTFGYTLCRETDSNSGVDINDIITNLYSYIPAGKENDIVSLLDQNANLTSNPNNYIISYHTSEADAENNINPVTVETQVDDGTILYIRVENADTGCYNAGNIGKVILREVNPPQFKVRHLSQHFDDPHALLVYDVEGSGNYEFSVNNGPWRELGTLQTLTFTGIEPGKHTVYGRDLSNCKQSEKIIHFITQNFSPQTMMVTTILGVLKEQQECKLKSKKYIFLTAMENF